MRHLPDHVIGVNSSDDGDIASLATREHGNVAGDLFIDCTGFPSLLLGKHFEVPFVSRKDVLFNDSALAAAGALRRRQQSDRVAHDLHGAGCGLDLGHRPADPSRRRLRVLERPHH